MSWPISWLQKLREFATKETEEDALLTWLKKRNKKPDVFNKPKPPKNNNPWKNLKGKGGCVGPNNML